MGIILFFDDWKIARRTRMLRRLGTPELCEEAVFEDNMTEGVWNYPTVWWDPQNREWTAIYGRTVPFSYDKTAGFWIKTVEFHRANSKDGIHWKKNSEEPVLSRETQLQTNEMGDARIDGGPAYYDNMEKDENKRLKLLFRFFDVNGVPQERIAYSRDGKVWTTEKLEYDGEKLFHSPSSIFYNKEDEKYYISNWFRLHDRRIVFYGTRDFQNIEDPMFVMQADGEDECIAETYTLIVVPYEHMYIGLLWMFHGDEGEIKLNPLKGYMDCQLVYSYNGKVFQRLSHTPFIARNKRGEHGGGSVFPTSVIEHKNHIYIYGSGSKGDMFRYQDENDAALLRYDLRKDGFVYLLAEGTGNVCTKALQFYGERLCLNVCAPYGTVKVRMLDESGQVIEGMSYEECTCKKINLVDWTPKWTGGRKLSDLKEQVVFLEIEITNGELYAIRGDFDVLGANYIKME
ncbi:hypothetical protein [Faecalicatena contorta]|uniref:hypothetical protein n=1 Tax=Faecalicatena contorta TaxID=39482 RepID=UPI00129DDCAB|nr:hypothetical protein [Faecalicatena contorta]